MGSHSPASTSTHYPLSYLLLDTLNLTLQEYYLALTMGKLNTNRYATKKTIAQGMLDIALLSTNAAQLKYILTVGEEHEYYLPMLILIVASIVLQAIVGVLFMIIGAINIEDTESQSTADTLNNVILIIVFFITVINALIGGFGIKDTDSRVINNIATSILSLK